MSENSAEGTDSKGKTIKVEVALTEEIKRALAENALLKQKLEERETLGLELFEMKKQEAIRAYPKMAATLKECNTPERLESFIDAAHTEQIAEYEKHGTTSPENKQLPYGKATIGYSGNSGSETFENRTALIDKLYDQGYYNCKNYAKQEQEDARNKIDTLFQSLANSKSMEELKRRPSALGEMMKKHSLSECPKCHRTLDGTDQCSCGYDSSNPKQTKDGYVFIGPEWPEAKERERMKRKGS